MHFFRRGLDHPHIVKFYATSLFEKDGVTRVVLLPEKCKKNLRTRIFNNRAFIPAETKDIANIKTEYTWLSLESVMSAGAPHMPV